MIRAIPSNASDNICCTLLAQSAVHGAMAGYTGFTIGPVNGRHAYIPFHRINEKQNKVVVADRIISSSDSLSTPRFRCFDPTNSNSYPDHTTNHKQYIPTTTLNSNSTTEMITPKIITGDNGYILEDVPHLSDYLTDLHTHPNPLQYNQTYSAVRQCFVGEDDSVAQQIVVQKDGPRGPHFRRAGPRQKVSFEPEEVNACIVTCGGLCPGLNTVIREIVCCLHHMYGVNTVHGIEVNDTEYILFLGLYSHEAISLKLSSLNEGGYKGFYARNTIPLTPKIVNDIHKRGGTILGTSRGVFKIEASIRHVYIIGGDGTQKGASVIFEVSSSLKITSVSKLLNNYIFSSVEIRRRGLKVAVAGIPKTIDNDIPVLFHNMIKLVYELVIDKSFGFDTAVEEAQRAINAAHVEAESFENGIGVVKLMGRHSGFIAMYASIASRDVDCCLIPESPFYLEGPGGLFEYIKRRLQENGHMVIVVAEGAGQENLSENTRNINQQDASGNKLLQDVGLWLTQKIKDYFSMQEKININLKYIDPTYMIRAIPSNASDNICCTLLAQSAVHGAMAGYTGFTIGPVNGRHAYIPFHRINERQNKVVVTDRMWARLLLGSTNQPSFLNAPDCFEDDHTEIHSENGESEENDHTTNHKHYIPTTTSNSNSTTEMITPKIVTGDNGYILEDVPHLSDYLTDLPTHPNPLQYNQTYSAVSFEPEEVNACIVTCGGLCPGLNTVIREIVCCLHHMYGVNTVHGIEGGYKGFYARNTIPLTPKIVNDIHKRGGTILGTSRGGHHTSKIVYIIGGDGTQKGASVIFEEIRRRGLKVAVAGIPKTIDNDIPVIDKSFGFDTAVEEAQRAINAAHVEAESFENGIGVVKLMGRHSGFIAMYASIASRDVDCCLIPESPFYLEGPGGLFEYIKRRLQENGHMVIVVAEGAGQENLSENTRNINQQDASGNKLLQDVGLWLTQKIKDYFSTQEKININLKYIDPTYMIRAIPSNASDNICCTLLAQSAVHGAMAGYTGFTIGPVNGRHAYIPFHRINERQNKVVVTDRMWARLLLGSTNQPSFLNAPDTFEDDHTEIPSENEKSEENERIS
ncbi:hypothetical protein G4B88_019796 [Cannabis sativa]|uniref:Phosphofructokinase domain-containing protein n=1 Tax=Cannabis sativa TaxID=3483 RepID=A0A7J6HSW2_CANSA|nr:hypothetical protein G4B88_019796 [Cannabis sativa]